MKSNLNQLVNNGTEPFGCHSNQHVFLDIAKKKNKKDNEKCDQGRKIFPISPTGFRRHCNVNWNGTL